MNKIISKENLQKMVDDGKYIQEIADYYNCAYCTIQRKLKKLGIKVKVGPAKGYYKHSQEIKDKLSREKIGSKNPSWVGDKAGYSQIHNWVRKNKPRYNKGCEHCGNLEKRLDVASKVSTSKKNNEFPSRDFSEWLWLCRSCHWSHDGRVPPVNNNRDKKTGRYKSTKE